jgi:signal transduction histidine kinase/ligand-binding sensor domain-containing protein
LELNGKSVNARSLPAEVRDNFLTTRWTTEDGLPQNTVTAIVQTRDGYLWLGTFGGLVRFDGLKFTVFDSSGTPALGSNHISALHEARDGALWIGTELGEIARFHDGEFTAIAPHPRLAGLAVQAIYEDRAGAIWIGARDAGLIRLEPANSSKTKIYSIGDGLPSNDVRSICEDRDGNLWIGSRGGLARIRNSEITTIPKIDGLTKQGILGIRPRASGGLWVVTPSSLGYLSGRSFTRLLNYQQVPSSFVGVTGGRAKDLWFSPAEGQLYHLEGDAVSINKWDGTPAVGVRSLLVDREGNYWVGSEGHGLIRLRKSRVRAFASRDGLPSGAIGPVIEDNAGAIWIGTGNVLSRLHQGKLTTYRAPNGEIREQGSNAVSLHADKAGNLWIGRDNGVARFRDGKFTDYPIHQAGLVFAIVEDRHGQLWFGCGGGLARLSNGEIKMFRESDGLVHHTVKAIAEDRGGSLWLGTIGGLSRFKDGVFTNYTTRDGLSNNYARAIYEDREGALWIGTNGGGLNRLKDGRIASITTNHGLFDDVVSRILADDGDNFWMLGNRGVFRASRRDLNDVADGKMKTVVCASYGVADGLLIGEGNGGGQPAGWRMRDGTLWVPTSTGIAIIDDDSIDQPPTPVLIEQVTLNREPVDIQRPIEIPPGEDLVEIFYTGLNFSHPESVRFKVMLEGFDADWVDAGRRRSVSYNNLRSGQYKFKVSAYNADGKLGETFASVSFVINPPFWLSRWFLTLLSFGLAGFVWIVYMWRVTELKSDQARQESFSRQLLDSQEHERKRIAAELHDGLSQSLVIIRNRAMLSLNLPEDHERALEQLKEIADASTYAIDEIKEIVYNLRPIQLDRLGLTGAIADMLDNISAAHGLAIARNLDNIDGVFSKDAENSIYRIVQESFSNIIKHAEAGSAGATIKKNPGIIDIFIKDDGKGFLADSTHPRGREGGFGLIGIVERARLLGGQAEIKSAPGRGTSVHIRLMVEGKRNDE